jgi:putative ABC transport system permease protein
VRVWEGVVLAFQQIWTEKLKSFFSVLGVILGVMFLIVVVTVVEGLDQLVREDFSSQVFGVNTVTLGRWEEISINTSREERRARQRRPFLYHADAEAIEEQLSIPARIVVENTGSASAVGDNGRTVTGVQIIGATPDIFVVRDLEISEGRAFTPQEAEAGAPVVVIGSETRDAIFEDGVALGRGIRIGAFPYRVIGVLAERGSMFGQSLDNQAIAPARSPVEAITSPHNVAEDIIIQAIDPDQLRDIQMEVEGIMRARRNLRPSEPNDFALETADEAISFWNTISRMLFTVLPIFVSVALVVGGIVIMNIMLVSVMERTREIGVRKALGARRRDILTQVLIESGTLATVGAVIGVAVGIGFAEALAAFTPMPSAVALRWILLGVGLGMTVGIVAGVYPASRASKLDPVDALRYE